MYTNRSWWRGAVAVLGSFAILSGMVPAARAQNAAGTLVVDDFENGVGNWTRNDKVKSDDPASGVALVDVAPIQPGPGGYPGSKLAGLFAFKAATNSWASVSERISGARWAQIGAQRLSFWINADGATPGVGMVLRGSARSADGSLREEVFELPKPVRLDIKQWRKVVIPLSDFRSNGVPATARLNDLYLLQFVQHGTWGSRFFDIDQIQVEGGGAPQAATTPAPVAVATAAIPAPPAATADVVSATVQVRVDYLRRQGMVRPSANTSIQASDGSVSGSSASPLTDNAQFRNALRTFSGHYVRLDAGALADLTDSSGPSFDFSRLVRAAAVVRGLKQEPLIAVTVPAAWGLDAHGYAVFAASAAAALGARSEHPVRYWELATAAEDSDTSDANALALYNAAYSALKRVNPSLRVGGICASSGREGSLIALLSGAVGMDFVTVQFYGASAGEPPTPALFAAAREVHNIKIVAANLDHSRFHDAPIFLTQANLSSAHDEGAVGPSDPRLVQMVSAAWWASFMCNASRLCDEIFHNDAVNPAWGLLDDSARAYPAYYALWMWNTFIPSGSQRVESTSSSDAVVTAAANTQTAHNLLLANTTANPVTVKIGIRGFPILHSARIRLLEDPLRGVTFQDLLKSPFQTILLKPYAVAVLQFTEPPRRR